MKVEDARRILGVSADSTEEEVKKAFRKHAMKWHPDKAGNVSDAVREDRTNKMKEINSAYVCLTQGESEQVDDFPEGFPWNMPEEVLASLMEQLFSTRMGGMRGARPRNSKGGRPQSFFPMGFSFEPMGEDPHSCDYTYHCDDSDDDDSDEYYPAGRSQRRHYQRRNNCSHEDLEKNRQAERNLHEHQKREAERLACDKQKAAVMKLIGKLAKPTRTVIDDTSISLTIDRNKKLHSELPDGGFWELQYKATHSRGSDSKWAPVSTYLRKTTVKVGQLTPGTSYDFRARGGYRSQLTGTDTLGDFSVVATLSTTGTKPKAPEVVPEPQKAVKSASPEDAKQKKGKGGKGSNGAQNRMSESNEEKGGVAEQQARAEEEAKKKLQREAVQKAQREKEAQQQAAEAAKKRQEEAKRDAEKNNAVQMRLAREAEEYQQLMAEHAHQGAGNNGKINGSAPESKAPKKKKKKKKTKAAPEDPAPSESHQQSVQSESRAGNAGDSSRKASGEQEDDASSAPQVKTSLSAEAEAIRAEALANGLDALGDEAFEALLEEQRAIAEECARNLAKQKQSSQQQNTPTSAISTQQPASTAGHAAAPPPSQPTSAHQNVPKTAPGVPAGAPNSSTGVEWQGAASAQPKHEASSNAQRTKPRPAAQNPHDSTGRGATRGAAVPCSAHVQWASVGAFHEEQVTDGSRISDVNVSGQQQGGYASTGVSQTHAGHGRVSQPADGVAASQRRGGQLQSPDSNVSSQSAASFNASHASAVSGEHSHPREPKGPITAQVPPHVPQQAPPQTHSYVDQSSHHSQGLSAGWNVTSSQPEHIQHPNGSQFPPKRMQHSTLPESLDPYAKASAQSIPRSRMQGMHDEQHHGLHNNFSAPVEHDSAYGNVRTHHSRYDSHQDYSLGNHFPPSAAAGWHPAPGPTWSQSEYQHPQAHAKYGPMRTQGHNMHGMRMQGEHPAQGGNSHMWSSAEGDAAMLHHQHGSHNMPVPPPHSRHLQQEHVWNDAIPPPMQPPPPPRAANVGSGGAMGRRMHAQSNPSTRGALFQAYSKRHSGSDNWAPNGTNANRPIDQHSSLYGPGHQKEAATGPKPPLFSHSAHYTEPPLSPEPHSMHLPEDLLEPAGAPPFGPNHLEGSAPNHNHTQQHTVSPLQLDAQQLSQWSTQQTTHQHVPPAYHHPVEWM